jgi:hypothetical protein
VVTDVVQRVKTSRRRLERALLTIAENWKLYGSNVADYKTLGPIEGHAHELAHTLDLGPDFETRIDGMGADEANSHEAAALRIEVAALARLGVYLSMRRLWASAKWEDSNGIPGLAQLRMTLNQHERNCVRRFVTMVTHEI